ncbi:hypothetical protein PV328_003243 [Microctonus aethiopoides]|uniref:Intersectin-1 n=1 Tax=Microctonus aethiopoides TaxID=144406 RepID=A0AA39F7Z9_9HYME|nr:hypothetical protein PV328_003243 [Microctonus aethiopoides]
MSQVPGLDPWVIQPRERLHYKDQFEALKPIGGIVTGDQVKGFLLRSQLPPPVLGKIWGLSDTDADGKMDVNEFSIACKLIHLKLKGLDVPPTLPPSLIQSLKVPLPGIGGVVASDVGNGSLVNLGGAAPPQQIATTPRPLVAGVQPTALPIGTQPARPVPPAQSPLALGQFRGNEGASGIPRTTNIPSKPPARPAPPFMGAGFTATTGILPPPKPAPPSFPNSPVGGAIPAASLTQSPLPVAPTMNVPLNTNPTTIAAFGMTQNITPLIQSIPTATVLPQVAANGGIATVPPQLSQVNIPTNGIGGVGQTTFTPVSTNTPLSTTARPPSIDRVGSIDSQHSQHSQQSVTSPQSADWAVPHQSKLKYTQLFNTWDRTRTGFLSGPQARNIMVQSKLPQAILAQIWALSDMDSDGRLGCEEFVLAMHLCDMAKAGETISPNLPSDLIPPTFRRQRQSSVSSSQGIPEIVDPSAGMPQSSFEDKRKENFEKGQAELERRRKALLEIQRKEQDERERKEREEADKLEKIRIEQERRRQAEIEKQMIRQREIEQEKEEQRKRAQEQRDAARKEMERQRQLEWETQKSQELQAQRQKEQEILLKLKAKNQGLTIELGSLNDKVKELSQKICDTRVGVSGVKTTIDGMRSTRDVQLQELAALKNKLREQNQRLLTLSQEKARIDAKNKINAAQDTVGQEAMKMAFANKQITLKQMRDKIADLQQQINEKMSDIENNNGQLNDIQSRMKNLISDCNNLYTTFENKRTKVMELRNSISNADYTSTEWTESAWGSTNNEEKTIDNSAWPVDNTPVATAVDDLSGIRKYRALYEFVARNEEEISFQPGDIILVPPVQNQEPGWMAGEIRGHTGWFPESYVEPVDSTVDDDTKTFVQQDSVEKRPLEEIAEVPENISDAGSLGGEATAPIDSVASTMSMTSTNVTATNISQGLSTSVEAPKDYYVALYQYSSTEPDDLSFNDGEIIAVTKKDGEWWTGTIGNRSGFFPSNYVEKCEPNINQIAVETVTMAESSVTAPAQETPSTEKTAEQLEDERAAAEDRAELPDFTAMASQQSRGRKPEIVQVIAPYQATSAEQLDLQRGQLIMIRKKTDSGWWEGELQARGKKRQIGWFPASYVKPLTSSSNRSTPVSHGYQDSPTDPNAERVMALYPHQAQNDDELSFDKGDVITVLAKQEEAWWKGELNGVCGIFPSNYVTPMCE